jgi:hypothetical protein
MAPGCDSESFFKRPLGFPCSIRDPAMPYRGRFRANISGHAYRRSVCGGIDADAAEGRCEGG